jgi:hypothetical protein
MHFCHEQKEKRWRDVGWTKRRPKTYNPVISPIKETCGAFSKRWFESFTSPSTFLLYLFFIHVTMQFVLPLRALVHTGPCNSFLLLYLDYLEGKKKTKQTLSLSFFLSLFLALVFWDRVLLCSPGWPQTHCAAQTGLEFKILLFQPPKCWDYRHEPPCLATTWPFKGSTFSYVFHSLLHLVSPWHSLSLSLFNSHAYVYT